MKKFTDSHEWISVDGTIGTVGVTNYAEKELGEIVFVELPSLGIELNAGDEAAVLESTKAASDIYTPVSGKITEVNQALLNQSSLVNSASETEGWIFKIKLSNLSELDSLMDHEKYEILILAPL